MHSSTTDATTVYLYESTRGIEVLLPQVIDVSCPRANKTSSRRDGKSDLYLPLHSIEPACAKHKKTYQDIEDKEQVGVSRWRVKQHLGEM
jgi:hypothetical protein